MLLQKNEIFIGKTSFIFDIIKDKSQADIQINQLYLYDIRDLTKYSKVNLLVIDNYYNDTDYLVLQNNFYIKNIVKLTKFCYKNTNTQLILPCRLSHLLDIISNYRKNKYIFCKINRQLLYDQQLSFVYHQYDKYHLSEKENEILALLLTSNNYQIHKQELQDIIWKYHRDVVSTTIHVHLFHLKKKLPKNFLQYKENYYHLEITHIE